MFSWLCVISCGIFCTLFTVVSSDLGGCRYVCWEVQCVSDAGAGNTDWVKPAHFVCVFKSLSKISNMRAADYRWSLMSKHAQFVLVSKHFFVLVKAPDNPKTIVSLPKEVISTQTQRGCDWQISHLKIGFGEQTQNPSAFFPHFDEWHVWRVEQGRDVSPLSHLQAHIHMMRRNLKMQSGRSFRLKWTFDVAIMSLLIDALTLWSWWSNWDRIWPLTCAGSSRNTSLLTKQTKKNIVIHPFTHMSIKWKVLVNR